MPAIHSLALFQCPFAEMRVKTVSSHELFVSLFPPRQPYQDSKLLNSIPIPANLEKPNSTRKNEQEGSSLSC